RARRARVRRGRARRRSRLSDCGRKDRRAGHAGRARARRLAMDAPVLRRRGGRARAVPLSGARLRARSRFPGGVMNTVPKPARAPRRNELSMIGDAIAQVGACGLFLLAILAAIPKSLRHIKETIRQVWFVGAMSLVIIMTCGLFVGMVLGLQL